MAVTDRACGTDWAAVIAADFAIPPGAEVGSLVTELESGLRSPDPQLRDLQAYQVLATWIRRGVLDAALVSLGDRMAEALRDKEIQARTFAVLILASAVNRDNRVAVLEREPILGWRDSFVRWYSTETDLRGWDESLGWLHAVAHGADLLDELGKSPRLGEEDLLGLLSLGAERLITPTDYLFAYEEDARLGVGLSRVLWRPELTAIQAVAWLDPIEEAFRNRDQSTISIWVSNTIRTLRVLYLLADRGVRDYVDGAWTIPARAPHEDALKKRIAEILRLVEPYAG